MRSTRLDGYLISYLFLCTRVRTKPIVQDGIAADTNTDTTANTSLVYAGVLVFVPAILASCKVTTVERGYGLTLEGQIRYPSTLVEYA